MKASRYGHKEIVEMLLQAGADKEAKTEVSSSSLCQLSNGYMLAVVAVIIIVGFHGFDNGI